MKSSYLVGGFAVAVVACGGSKSGGVATKTVLDSGSMLEVGSVSGAVKNVDSPKPTCPIIPHYDATLTATKLSGTVTYRWERSTGEFSKVREVTLTEAARTGTATLPLEADEWLHKVRGLQVTFTDKVHVLTPVDRMSQAMPLDGICY